MQQNHPKSVHLLDMQYRMHPQISAFPSREFYEGQLKDGQDMGQLRQQPWHRSTLLGPYRFFDVQGVQERGHRGQSLVNTRELDVALQMYERFSKDYRECDLQGKIGIITPYKAQLFELRNRFKARYGEGITDIIEFNTTDAFQGRECEIIIFSCVRASSTGGIGFMTDIRRMNVGLTRAKSSLWILGDSRALVQGEFWKKLIEDARARDCYTSGDILAKFRRPLEQNPNAPAPASGASTPAHASDSDVAMLDAPPPQPVKPSRPAEKPSPTRGAIPGFGAGNPPSVTPRPANAQGPVIHTSADRPRSADAKKRPLDGAGTSQPSAKRMANESHRSTLAGKFGQKPIKPPKAPKGPTDPSAMSVLGMTPPERPPPPPATSSAAAKTSSMNPPPNGPTSFDRQQQPNTQRPPAQAPPRNGPPANAPTGPRKKKSKPSFLIQRR